ncbi:hypothetical protein ACFQHW_02950 [Lapidilactobacillus achengensis]|uniref:Uncharacterized protein n=1 Tax=Lapidilactobacillus achengensis TaxID=2486000 RepID=A0ABW1ULH3_9LACO|nr:hypothetical protein [Lapidilactobacillus achengensis]
MKPIPKAGIVSKSSLVLSGKAAKDNFTTEPRSPSRLLGRIELICNRSWVFDEVLLRASGQTIAHFWGGPAMPTDSGLVGWHSLHWLDRVTGYLNNFGMKTDQFSWFTENESCSSGRLYWCHQSKACNY